LHDRNPLFVKLSDGSIRNGYDVKILNKTHDDKKFLLKVAGIEGAIMKIQGSGNITSNDLPVFADSVGHYRVFITAMKQVEERRNIKFIIVDNETNLTRELETIFVSGK